MSTSIDGDVDPSFAPVRAAFAASFERFPEIGAALSVTLRGRTVVDVWGGFMDGAKTRPWHRDTLVCVFSVTKGAVALCAHRLAERGALDLDAPVATYWPEFAAAGKAGVLVKQLLDHTAGLPAIRAVLPMGTVYDWKAMIHALETEAPWWEPGTRHGYHALTFGFLVGEVIRRVTGRTVGTYFREEIAAPLGLDFHIGLTSSSFDSIAEIGPILPPPGGKPGPAIPGFTDPESIAVKAFFNPPDLAVPDGANTEAWRRAEIPASNGHTNARSIARMYGALANGGELDGVRLVKPETVARALEERSFGVDAVIGLESRFSLGFMLPSALRPYGRGPRVFGHPGAGGALGFADPDRGLSFAYVPNQTITSGLGGDPRWPGLIDAVYACL